MRGFFAALLPVLFVAGLAAPSPGDGSKAEDPTFCKTAPTEAPQNGDPPAAEPVPALPDEAARERGLPPLKEMISSPFGRRRMPGWRSRRGLVMREHSGVDLRGRLDWPVIAFKSGTVTIAGDMGASGLVVEVRQGDGLSARYAHLGKILVSKGQRVETGERLGLVGCTGRTTGAHLHFGLKNAKGVFIDPLPHLHSAEQVLAPAPDQIPEVLIPQQCRPKLKTPLRPVQKKKSVSTPDA